MLFDWQGTVTDCSEIRIFKNTKSDGVDRPVTPFKLSVWGGDSNMWNMFLANIPKEHEVDYKVNLKAQLDALKNDGLEYEINNVKLCGLRVLFAEPTESQKQDVIDRNAYLFIIMTNPEANKDEYHLGFSNKDQTKYLQVALTKNSELLKISYRLKANFVKAQIEGFSHYITREKADLIRARNDLEALGVQTRITYKSSKIDLESFNNELDNIPSLLYSSEYSEQWIINVGYHQRLASASMWQRLITAKVLDEDSDAKYFMKSSCPSSFLLDMNAQPIFPISVLLGGQFSYILLCSGGVRRTKSASSISRVRLMDLWLAFDDIRMQQLNALRVKLATLFNSQQINNVPR